MKKKLLICSFILLIGVILFSGINFVYADSGWDSGYGIGGFGSGSGFGGWTFGGWNYSSSSRSSGFFDVVVLFVYFVVIPALAIYHLSVTQKNAKKKEIDDSKYRLEDYEGFKKYLPTYDIKEVRKQLVEIFKEIQIAWMNFDYDKLRSLCTDELYNTYKTQLEVLKAKKGQNIMSQFKIVETRIYSVKEVNGIVQLDVYMSIHFYDYVINTEDDIVTRGSEYRKIHNKYLMTFVIKTGNKAKVKCPNCGAEVKEHSTDCEYCKTKIVTVKDSFILAKKTNIKEL